MPEAFHRAVFVFVCDQKDCFGAKGTIKAFRSQLPRVNAFCGREAIQPIKFADPKFDQVIADVGHPSGTKVETRSCQHVDSMCV